MKPQNKLRIDYRFLNWGKTERIVCEQDQFDDNVFFLLKQGQNIGTITKQNMRWISSPNSMLLPAEVVKIGSYIDEHLRQEKRVRSASKST